MNATPSLFFDTRRPDNNKRCFVRIRVYWLKTQKDYTTGERISPDEWKFLDRYKAGLPGTVKDEDRRALWQRFYGHYTDPSGKPQDGYLKRAQNIIDRLGDDFTFDTFAEKLQNYGKAERKPDDQTNLIAAIKRKADSMEKAGRIGNAINYHLAAKSLQRFVDSFSDEERKEFLSISLPSRKRQQSRPIAILRFEHLTPDFLTTYEQWMLHCGKASQSPNKPATGASLTTVGIYLRHVRAVIKEGIDSGLLNHNVYPFGRGRYVIPQGKNIKKALSKDDLEKIKSYQPLPGTMEQRSHDLWLFSYFSNGINMTDICHLKWAAVSLKERKFTFVRQKTIRSKKQNQTPIVALLRDETLSIIERWANTTPKPQGYVFPFLTEDMSATQQKQAVHQTIKITNKWMGRIGQQLGIEGDICTYSARHSYATTLLKSKAPLAFISKSLGHTNIKTTESYLGSFDDDEARAFLEAL